MATRPTRPGRAPAAAPSSAASPDALCAGCKERDDAASAVEKRRRAFALTVTVTLWISAVLYALPALLALQLINMRGGAVDGSLLVFALIYSAPPAFSAVLVSRLRRPWPVLFAIPTALFSLFLIFVFRDRMAAAYAFALFFTAVACARAAHWKLARLG